MIHPAARLLKPRKDNIVILDSNDIINAPPQFVDMLDKLGKESAETQGLNHIITTHDSVCRQNVRLYFLTDDSQNMIIGFCKVGYKRLFVLDGHERQHVIQPLCLLDFYVSSNMQRSGYGKKIYDAMISNEKTEPRLIAIDKPSKLCLAFMRRHYDLKDYVIQNNNFVVYNDYWSGPHQELPMREPLSGAYSSLDSYRHYDYATRVHSYSPRFVRRYNPITWQEMR